MKKRGGKSNSTNNSTNAKIQTNVDYIIKEIKKFINENFPKLDIGIFFGNLILIIVSLGLYISWRFYDNTHIAGTILVIIIIILLSIYIFYGILRTFVLKIDYYNDAKETNFIFGYIESFLTTFLTFSLGIFSVAALNKINEGDDCNPNIILLILNFLIGKILSQWWFWFIVIPILLFILYSYFYIPVLFWHSYFKVDPYFIKILKILNIFLEPIIHIFTLITIWLFVYGMLFDLGGDIHGNLINKITAILIVVIGIVAASAVLIALLYFIFFEGMNFENFFDKIDEVVDNIIRKLTKLYNFFKDKEKISLEKRDEIKEKLEERKIKNQKNHK